MRKNRKMALLIVALAAVLLLVARALWNWLSANPIAAKVGPVGGPGGNLATPHFAWSELLRGNRDTANPPIAPFAVPQAGTVFESDGSMSALGKKMMFWANLLEKVRTAIGDKQITARLVTVAGPGKPMVVFWSTNGDTTQDDLRAAATTVAAGSAVTFDDGSVSPIVTGNGSFGGADDEKGFVAPAAVVWST